MKKGKVIILNGPPSSGKDEIAKMISKKGLFGETAFHEQVKGTLFKQVLALSQISSGDWFDRYNDRNLKELPWDRLGGLSQREFMIKVSEEYVKPVFGKDFYGRMAGQRAKKLINDGFHVAFSDGGFSSELDAMKSIVGDENILLVRLHRYGCTFEGDSRSHLSNPPFEMDLHNDSTLEEAVQKIEGRIYEGFNKFKLNLDDD